MYGATDELNAALEAVNANQLVVYQQLDSIRANILGREGQILERPTRELFTAWQVIREEVAHLMNSGRKQAAIQITKRKGAAHVALLEKKMLELTVDARRKATTFVTNAEKRQTRRESVSVILTLAGVVLSACIAFFTSSANRGRARGRKE